MVSLVEAMPGVHPAWARAQFLRAQDKRRKTRFVAKERGTSANILEI
jgi:hypothetical protein